MLTNFDEDTLDDLQKTKEELREAEERLAQAAAIIAKQQELIASYRKLGDDTTVRFMALAESMKHIK